MNFLDPISTAINFGPNIIKALFLFVIFVFGSILGGIFTIALQVVTMVISGTDTLLQSHQIAQAQQVMLGGTNVLLFLGLAVMAILVMTGAEKYNVKKALSGLIYAILLANLSYEVVLAFVSLANKLKDGIQLAFQNLTGVQNIFTQWKAGITYLINPTNLVSGATDWGNLGKDLIFTIAILVSMGISAYVMVKLAVVMIERAIRLAIAIIFAPLVFIVQIFPGTGLEGLAKNWWSDLIKWVLILPVVYFLLGIGGFLFAATTSQGAGGTITGPSLPSLAAQIIDPNQANPDPNLGLDLMLLIAGLGITYAAAGVPGLLQLKGLASEFITKPIDKGFIDTVKSGGSNIWKPLASSRAGKAIKNSSFGYFARQADVNKQARDARNEATKNNVEKANVVAANQANAERATAQIADIEKGALAYAITKIPGTTAKSFDELTPEQTDQYFAANPAMKSRYDVAKALRNKAINDSTETQGKIDPTPDSLFNSIAKTNANIATNPTKVTAQEAYDNRGKIGRLVALSRGNGKDADRARELLGYLASNRTEAGQEMIAGMDAKAYEKFIKSNVGYVYGVSAPHTPSEHLNPTNADYAQFKTSTEALKTAQAEEAAEAAKLAAMTATQATQRTRLGHFSPDGLKAVDTLASNSDMQAIAKSSMTSLKDVNAATAIALDSTLNTAEKDAIARIIGNVTLGKKEKQKRINDTLTASLLPSTVGSTPGELLSLSQLIAEHGTKYIDHAEELEKIAHVSPSAGTLVDDTLNQTVAKQTATVSQKTADVKTLRANRDASRNLIEVANGTRPGYNIAIKNAEKAKTITFDALSNESRDSLATAVNVGFNSANQPTDFQTQTLEEQDALGTAGFSKADVAGIYKKYVTDLGLSQITTASGVKKASTLSEFEKLTGADLISHLTNVNSEATQLYRGAPLRGTTRKKTK